MSVYSEFVAAPRARMVLTDHECSSEEVGTHECNCIGKMKQEGGLWVHDKAVSAIGCLCTDTSGHFNGCYCDRSKGFYKVMQLPGCPCHTSRTKRCNDGAKFDVGHKCINENNAFPDDYNCDTWDYTLTWLLGGTIIIAAIATPLLIKWYKYLDAQLAKLEQQEEEKAESQL